MSQVRSYQVDCLPAGKTSDPNFKNTNLTSSLHRQEHLTQYQATSTAEDKFMHPNAKSLTFSASAA